jgi:class 3 adenylate cyclase
MLAAAGGTRAQGVTSMDDLVYSDRAFADHRQARSRMAVGYGLLALALMTALYLPHTLGNGYGLMATEQVAVVLAALAAFLVVRTRPSHFIWLRHFVLILSFIHIWVIVFIAEGVPATGTLNSSHWWFVPIALMSLIVLFDSTLHVRALYVAVTVASFITVEASFLSHTPLEVQSASDMESLIVPTHILVVVVTLTLAFISLYDIHEAEKHLDLVNSRLESLLDNMLPKSIATRLRREGRTFADGYAQCSVLFADLVGFTTLSSRLKPEEVVRFLDESFSRFDELTERHGLEKIKTIGDAYMVAAGIPIARDDHAHALVRLALEMRSLVQEYAGIKIRIGINSGAVVAGIIGKKRFIYDLWGDTVNIASRMESQGMSDAIQVSEATRHLIEDEFVLSDRGDLEIKGRGVMKVYFVLGRRLEKVPAEIGRDIVTASVVTTGHV